MATVAYKFFRDWEIRPSTLRSGAVTIGVVGSGRARAAYMGLAVAGLLWCVATLVAAAVAVGPAGATTCPDPGLERTTVSASFQLVPFGPACRHEHTDPFGEPYDRVDVDPPAPVWRTALGAGALTGLVGAAGLVATTRPGAATQREGDDDSREREPVGGGSGVNRRR